LKIPILHYRETFLLPYFIPAFKIENGQEKVKKFLNMVFLWDWQLVFSRRDAANITLVCHIVSSGYCGCE